ncbi:hypothetical protein HYALB_00007422 [Hymenoscyphus albidus]|uniref:DNA2/NAM7 helicase helicase domain-containing protein n=1 Tax=Hymenoscyphus albidus TaxID=595503 RepID=A0A9N9LRW4_9HELO|nr:hypothetical protein HYALB_00007422 [Hymenoscyphus albidus]
MARNSGASEDLINSLVWNTADSIEDLGRGWNLTETGRGESRIRDSPTTLEETLSNMATRIVGGNEKHANAVKKIVTRRMEELDMDRWMGNDDEEVALFKHLSDVIATWDCSADPFGSRSTSTSDKDISRALHQAWSSALTFVITHKTNVLLTTFGNSISPAARHYKPSAAIFNEVANACEIQMLAAIRRYLPTITRYVAVGDPRQLGPHLNAQFDGSTIGSGPPESHGGHRLSIRTSTSAV